MARHAAAMQHRGWRQVTHEERDVRKAWMWLLMFPVTFVVASLLGEGALSLLEYETGSGEAAPLGYALLVGLPAVAIAVAPGVVAWFYGSRARHAGDEKGLAPAVIGATAAAAFLVLNLAAVVFGR